MEKGEYRIESLFTVKAGQRASLIRILQMSARVQPMREISMV